MLYCIFVPVFFLFFYHLNTFDYCFIQKITHYIPLCLCLNLSNFFCRAIQRQWIYCRYFRYLLRLDRQLKMVYVRATTITSSAFFKWMKPKTNREQTTTLLISRWFIWLPIVTISKRKIGFLEKVQKSFFDVSFFTFFSSSELKHNFVKSIQSSCDLHFKWNISVLISPTQKHELIKTNSIVYHRTEKFFKTDTFQLFQFQVQNMNDIK